jgi:nucleoside-diphosphate-sugar epimerase
MRALITGATGFLGSHLARQLVERGDDVVALVRTTSDRSRLEGLAIVEAIGDVTDPGSVVRALDGVDQVFHCAGVVEFGPRDRSFLDRVNVDGTRTVLDAAVAAGVPAVHVSSLAALGATVLGEEPKDETWWSAAPPAAVYEETKRLGHEHARALAAEGAAIRIVMPGGIYGVGDQSTLHDLIRAYSLWPLPVGYFPEIRQSTVHIDDCADALLRVADRVHELGGSVAV